MSHPILTQLGITLEDLTIVPKHMSNLDNMIFIQNQTPTPVLIKVHEDNHSNPQISCLPSNGIDNYCIHGTKAIVSCLVEDKLKFSKSINQGQILTITPDMISE
jgi:hypothetical protein